MHFTMQAISRPFFLDFLLYFAFETGDGDKNEENKIFSKLFPNSMAFDSNFKRSHQSNSSCWTCMDTFCMYEIHTDDRLWNSLCCLVVKLWILEHTWMSVCAWATKPHTNYTFNCERREKRIQQQKRTQHSILNGMKQQIMRTIVWVYIWMCEWNCVCLCMCVCVCGTK